MRNELRRHIQYIDSILSSTHRKNIRKIKRNHLLQIQFFQYERHLHFLVTALIFIVLMIGILFETVYPSIEIFLLDVLLFCLLIPYVIHYSILENGVQKMYRQYWALQEKEREQKRNILRRILKR